MHPRYLCLQLFLGTDKQAHPGCGLTSASSRDCRGCLLHALSCAGSEPLAVEGRASGRQSDESMGTIAGAAGDSNATLKIGP